MVLIVGLAAAPVVVARLLGTLHRAQTCDERLRGRQGQAGDRVWSGVRFLVGRGEAMNRVNVTE
eukprot:954936-Pleurochrysis_carterae.AAC.1